MYKISKEFHFSASHILEGLPEGHQCGRLHGHNYVVVIHLQCSQLDSTGFVQDYGELDNIKTWIDKVLDHQHLNDVFDFNPTAENIARHIYMLFADNYPMLKAVEVKETPKTSAIYSI